MWKDNITCGELNDIKTLMLIKYSGHFNKLHSLNGARQIIIALWHDMPNESLKSNYIKTGCTDTKDAWYFALADNSYFENR